MMCPVSRRLDISVLGTVEVFIAVFSVTHGSTAFERAFSLMLRARWAVGKLTKRPGGDDGAECGRDAIDEVERTA